MKPETVTEAAQAYIDQWDDLKELPEDIRLDLKTAFISGASWQIRKDTERIKNEP